jgi:hypothetical protein
MVRIPFSATHAASMLTNSWMSNAAAPEPRSGWGAAQVLQFFPEWHAKHREGGTINRRESGRMDDKKPHSNTPANAGGDSLCGKLI